jgi:hypothetical protein
MFDVMNIPIAPIWSLKDIHVQKHLTVRHNYVQWLCQLKT